MKCLRIPALALAALLQFCPLLRVAALELEVIMTPGVALFRWLAAGATLAGSFHAVSAATGLTISQGNVTDVSPRGTNSVLISGYRVNIESADYGAAMSYLLTGLPPGLTGSQQGLITGKPTASGPFTVNVIGYEKPERLGHNFETVFPFNIVDLAPSISMGPTNQTVAAGASVSFMVSANGTNLKYRWLKDDIEISQAVSPTYAISSVAPGHAGTYKVRLSNSGGTLLSTPALLTVTAVVPTVTAAPDALNLHEGETAAFTAQVSGPGPFTYRWLKGSQPVVPATNATLAFPQVSLTDDGSYNVAVNSAAGRVTSGPVVLRVFARPLLVWDRLNGTAATLATTSVSNRSYILEGQADLGLPAWNPERTNLAVAGELQFTNVFTGSPRRFWRVRVVPLAP